MTSAARRHAQAPRIRCSYRLQRLVSSLPIGPSNSFGGRTLQAEMNPPFQKNPIALELRPP